MGAVGGAVLLFAVGPRTRVRLDGPTPSLASPDEAARRVAEREGAIADLRPGNEARIKWGGEPGKKTPVSFIHLHGFSASRRETAPLSENLARAYGANLFEARLAGHGQSGASFGAAKPEAWVYDTREAIAIGRALGDRVVVIGSSTGATLAMLVAATDAPDVAAYVLLSPNFGPKSAAAGLLLWPWAERWLPLLLGKERSWEPESEDHGKYWTTRYPVAVLFSMMAVVERARTVGLHQIRAPIQILHTADDPVVDPMATEAAFVRMTSAEPRERIVVDGPGDQHVLAGDILSPQRTAVIEQKVKDFLQRAGLTPAP